MREWLNLFEGALTEGRGDVVFHATDWHDCILSDDILKAMSKLPVRGKERRGVCVTRAFSFAKAFAHAILELDAAKLRQRFRFFPRAEEGAYDLANEHGDYRIEAEEFIACPNLKLSQYLKGIYLATDSFGRVLDDGEYAPGMKVSQHPLFKGYYRH